ncbi:MAG: hypothetical protein ACLFP2_00710 [Candidatus Woesearchaeota archaeon]
MYQYEMLSKEARRNLERYEVLDALSDPNLRIMNCNERLDLEGEYAFKKIGMIKDLIEDTANPFYKTPGLRESLSGLQDLMIGRRMGNEMYNYITDTAISKILEDYAI